MDDDTEKAFNALRVAETNQEELIKAIQILANGSKQSSAVRQRLAAEILGKILGIVEARGEHSINGVDAKDSALRCLGNACIENDEARTFMASQGFQWALPLLRDREDLDLQRLTALVLYNICSDHEAAQKRAYEDAIHLEIIKLLGGTKSGAVMSEQPRWIELLFWLSAHHQSTATKPGFTEEQLRTLLLLPTSLDLGRDEIESYAELVEACLGFLRDQQIQEQAVETNIDSLIYETLERTEVLIREAQDEADARLLIPISASLTWVLSDLVALPSFVPKNADAHESGLVSKAISTISHFGSGEEEQHDEARLINAACQVVGNYVFALVPETYESFVTQMELHKPVLAAMAEADSADLLHSAAGFLALLSRPSIATRQAIGADPRAILSLERLCRNDNRQLKQDGVKLIKSLGRDCAANQQRFAELARTALDDLAATPDQTEVEPSLSSVGAT